MSLDVQPPVDENCNNVAKSIVEKSDWSNNVIQDLELILEADLRPVVEQTKKHIADIKASYIQMIQDDKTSTDVIKKNLIEFLNRVGNYRDYTLRYAVQIIKKDLSDNNAKDTELLANPSTFTSEEKLNIHIDKLRGIILKSCASVIGTVKAIDFEQNIQSALVHRNIAVPNFFYTFEASSLPELNEDLIDDLPELNEENQTKDAVKAIIQMAYFDMSIIVREIDSQIIDAQTAFKLNIDAATKLTAEEKTSLLDKSKELLRQYNETLDAEQKKISQYFTETSATKPANITEFINIIQSEMVTRTKILNENAEKFYADFIPLTKNVN